MGRRGRYDGVDCGAAAEGKRGAAAADLHFCEGILRRIKISAGREGVHVVIMVYLTDVIWCWIVIDIGYIQFKQPDILNELHFCKFSFAVFIDEIRIRLISTHRSRTDLSE